MHPAKLAVPLPSLLLSAVAALYACDSGNGGGSAFDAGQPGYEAGGSAFDVGISSSGSGSSSSSSGAMVYTCPGCIDNSGHCQSGTADNKCGKSSSTCVDCAGFSPVQVCGSAGECIAAPLDGGMPDSDSDGQGGSDGATDADGAMGTDGSASDGSAPDDGGGAG